MCALTINTIENKKGALIFLFLGFISGAPFLLVLSTLAIWLTELNISNTVIGALALTTIPYSLKPLLAPYIDNVNIPILEKFLSIKYSWGVLSNISLAIAIVGLGLTDPEYNLITTIVFAILISCCAATQDIAIDALRIELTPHRLLGIVSAMSAIGFRAGMLASGVLPLYIAEYYSWLIAYSVMGAIVICGSLVFCLLQYLSLIKTNYKKQITLNNNGTMPCKYRGLKLFWHSLRHVMSQPYFVPAIAMIFFYKVADSSLNSMSAPFIYTLGFNKIEYANISKFFGAGMMICGSAIGGWLVTCWNATLSLKLYGTLQILSACMFIVQIYKGHNTSFLILTLGLESFTSGLGSVALVSYLAQFCKPPFTATNFAVLYSFGSLCRVAISLAAGLCADFLGWEALFLLVSALTIPIFYCLRHPNLN